MDTIIAIATPPGIGALAIIRLSGNEAFEIVNTLFTSKNLLLQQSHTLHVGFLVHNDLPMDEVVVSLYKNPRSFTGEDVVEITSHGSPYIIKKIVQVCIELGARLALAGEFTQRAFLNRKIDLSQAEAIADLIASENKSQHQIALNQLRGGFSSELSVMRDKLIHLAAMLELELDFSEEDIAFADRKELYVLLQDLKIKLTSLANSFEQGNAIKNGIPVAIVGKPNAGKSTLLNFLLNEERAIVSNIAGTTRDTIEDVITIKGIAFRLIDTAGIRNSKDTIENLGIEKTFQKIKEASIVIIVADANEDYKLLVEEYALFNIEKHQKVLLLLNKIDTINVCDSYDIEEHLATTLQIKCLAVSIKDKLHTDKIEQILISLSNLDITSKESVVVNNIRHFEAINNAIQAIDEAKQGFDNNLSSELVAMDLRSALKAIGTITGQVEVDKDILGTIFGKFCIGK
jgi:tRNA modification GTPase